MLEEKRNGGEIQFRELKQRAQSPLPTTKMTFFLPFFPLLLIFLALSFLVRCRDEIKWSVSDAHVWESHLLRCSFELLKFPYLIIFVKTYISGSENTFQYPLNQLEFGFFTILWCNYFFRIKLFIQGFTLIMTNRLLYSIRFFQLITPTKISINQQRWRKCFSIGIAYK